MRENLTVLAAKGDICKLVQIMNPGTESKQVTFLRISLNLSTIKKSSWTYVERTQQSIGREILVDTRKD